MSHWKNITILDLEVLVSIHQLRSVRAVARKLQLNPSHVSKIVKRLEEKLDKPLYKTSSSGIVLTREANDIVAYAEEILRSSNKLVGKRSVAALSPKEVITIGSLSFLNKTLISRALTPTDEEDYRFRLLDLSPDQLPLAAFKGVIELAVHTNPDIWTKAWDVKKIGSIRWALVARKDHPVVSKLSVTEVVKHAFVVPTYWENSHYVSGDDFFPIHWTERVKGHEASTADTALQLVLSTHHLAFLPELLLRTPLADSHLIELKLPDIPAVRRDVFLLTRMDLVKKKVQQQIHRQLAAFLKDSP